MALDLQLHLNAQLSMSPCPLCANSYTQNFCTSDVERSYLKCSNCELVFTKQITHLNLSEEKSRYAKHENNLEQKGYREYLQKMWEALYPKLSNRQSQVTLPLTGLDFGCGPTNAFQEFAREFNFEVASYDPYFFNDKTLLNKKFDFIWASEVFEHFNNPAKTIAIIMNLLKTDGLLAVRTEMYPPANEFITWYYQRDPTHVVFYNESTLAWIAKNWNLKFTLYSKNVCLFEK